VKAAALSDWGVANLADQNSNHDIKTLAGALVCSRTGDSTICAKTRSAILSAIGTDANFDPNCTSVPNMARSLAIARNLSGYIIASDIIGLRQESDDGSRWASYVQYIRFKENCSNTGGSDRRNLSESHDQGPSNASTQAGAARIAAALYLADTAELERAWETFQRYAGDRSKCPTCTLDSHLSPEARSWSSSPSIPLAINPLDAMIAGHTVDGATVADISRGCSFTWPPCYTQYPWVGLEGFTLQAQLLARAGYPSWQVQNDAPKRAVAYLKYLADQFGTQWFDRTHWVKYVVNKAYGANFPAGPAKGGNIMAWTDWTHQ
jgi:hypothetical protein